MKDKQVAVVYNDDGSCKYVAIVKVVSQPEYNKLLNEKSKLEQDGLKKEQSNKKHLEQHDLDIKKLFKRDLIIAKAHYDKFVDRGYIDENKEFDKKFYDFIFENKPLLPTDYPQEFKTILERLGNL